MQAIKVKKGENLIIFKGKRKLFANCFHKKSFGQGVWKSMARGKLKLFDGGGGLRRRRGQRHLRRRGRHAGGAAAHCGGGQAAPGRPRDGHPRHPARQPGERRRLPVGRALRGGAVHRRQPRHARGRRGGGAAAGRLLSRRSHPWRSPPSCSRRVCAWRYSVGVCGWRYSGGCCGVGFRAWRCSGDCCGRRGCVRRGGVRRGRAFLHLFECFGRKTFNVFEGKLHSAGEKE